jgi:hypothetical protein
MATHHGGGDASTAFSGSPETFRHDPSGTFTDSSFPTGWSDVAQITGESKAPQPSAVVIQTTDAFGHATQALATLPAIAESQGIYRPIDPADFYKTQVDVRIDQFSDVDPSVLVEDPNNPGFLLCGCPVGAENFVDWPIQVGFSNLDGSTDPSIQPAVGIIASAETHTWRLGAGTANVLADVDLGVQIEEGRWYRLETDFDAASGVLHGVVTDIASGDILADKMAFLADPKYSFAGGTYDPAIDGMFNSEAYFDGEHSLLVSTDPTLTNPGLAVIDNIDTFTRSPGNAWSGANDHGSAQWLDSILCDHG